MSDFHVLVVSDCSGTYDRALHDATMQNIRLSFGAVAASDEIVRAWETAARAQPTALVQPVA
jgi:nicotinamidase-related amidase